eukprot:Hpha_TRINITY_DN26480_c0_g1::TRINITY_DN26480_c0_g1_i1::g.33913::m.33913
MSGVDACEEEQSGLLAQFVLSREGKAASAPGGNLAPYVPCATGRLPYIRRALRLKEGDVLWDLGCGNGRVLLDAAERCGCHVVGVEIEGICLEEAIADAKRRGLEEKCRWFHCDLMKIGKGWSISGDMGPEASAVDGREGLPPPPDAVVCFLTGHGLCLLDTHLREEWQTGRFRLATCVEALDNLVDHLDEGSLFDAETNRSGWEVCRGDKKWGVFVVPPRGVTLSEWEATPAPLALTPGEADRTAVSIIPQVFTPEEIATIISACDPLCGGDEGTCDEGEANLFDCDGVADMEDAYHARGDHRVVHLHGCMPPSMGEIARKLREVMEQGDIWGVLPNRTPGAVNVRSLEYHRYLTGGGVGDPEHRDAGSLLTISVLLSTPGEDFEGGGFVTWDREGKEVEQRLAKPGDAVLFLSEKRHNVREVKGRRRTLISELWEGPANKHNRHR